MAKHSKAASHYARAILEADSSKAVDELRTFSQLTSEHAELSRLFKSRVFSTDKVQGVISDLGAKLKLSEATVRVLALLAENRRLGILPEIVEKLEFLQLARQNTARIEVASAGELSSAEKQQIESRISKVLKRQVKADYKIDPSLLGGARVTADGQSFDGSVFGWLSRFKEQMSEGRM